MSTARMETPAARHDAERRIELRWTGVIGGEMLKLVGLRSTFWCWLAAVLVSALVSVSVAAGAQPAARIEHDPVIMRADQAAALTDGSQFTYLIVAVVSVLVMTGEFTTGAIRSTLAAVPTRLPVLVGKAVTVAAFAAATGLGAVVVSWAVSAPILAGKGYELGYLHPSVYGSGLRAVVFLIVISLISLGLGTLVRSTVGGVALAFALMQVIPLICGAIGGGLNSVVAWNLTWFFPSSAAGRAFYGSAPDMEQFDALGHLQMTSGQAFGLLIAWLGITSTLAVVTFRRAPVPQL